MNKKSNYYYYYYYNYYYYYYYNSLPDCLPLLKMRSCLNNYIPSVANQARCVS